MRNWMVAGNWKMHNTIQESIALARIIKGQVGAVEKGEVVIAPPFTALHSVYEAVRGSRVALAAQNMFYEDKGAYTGETSPVMLKDVGCEYVIIGHSERRKYFAEQDGTVNLKVKKGLAAGLKPIVCVGETDDEREKGVTEFVVGIQVRKALNGIESLKNLVIAYEPVWAIGTGKTASPMEAEEVHGFIRNLLSEIYGDESRQIMILYGGSVTPENISDLMEMEDIDGALVGGASLKGETFTGIIKKVLEKRAC
jgi:triosephosphate isomerase (TIM)